MWHDNGVLLTSGDTINIYPLRSQDDKIQEARLLRVFSTVSMLELMGVSVFVEIYTLLGNSQGSRCDLPFLYSGKWYWDCTSEGREDRHLWCSTTSRYDRELNWGFCPTAGMHCCGQNVVRRWSVKIKIEWSSWEFSVHKESEQSTHKHTNRVVGVRERDRAISSLWLNLAHVRHGNIWSGQLVQQLSARNANICH